VIPEAIGLGAIALGGAAAWVAVRRSWMRQIVQDRLFEPAPVTTTDKPAPVRHRPFLRRYDWIPWLCGVGAAATVWLIFRPALGFVLMPLLLIALLGGQIEIARVNRKLALIETQLAEAIDMMIGALHAGASVLVAFENALAETREPLRTQFQELVGRIRYGDDPQTALRALGRRVPLETFSLFTTALAVHWEVGGSLAPTLATVGAAIRDRIDLSRRIRALSGQSRASVLAVLSITYVIGIIIWRNNPGRMHEFLSTDVGVWLVTMAVVLQAVGVVWSAALSRIRF
jgi:Flp pilus assembly protein TadB